MTDANEIYRELFEYSPEAMLIIEDERFVDCNPAAARMLRFPSRQALLDRFSGGKEAGTLRAHPAEFSPPKQPDGRDSFEKAEEMMQIAIERGSNRFEWDHVRSDGEIFAVEVVLTTIDRGPKNVMSVMWHEIAERKKLEQELRQSQRLESIGRLAGGIAHDFNNLLLVILSNAEILRDEIAAEDSTPIAESVLEILGAGERAAALTRQLLTFSRGQPLRPRPTDLVEIIGGLSSLLERLIGEDIQFEPRLPGGPVTVLVDPTQIEQLVVNLVANSRDAMPEGGRLELDLTSQRLEDSSRLPAGDYAAIRVTDTGEGMNTEQLERAFDPFYTTKAPGAGSGLGLATVHSIAEQCEGGVWIESAPGEGASVSFLVPLCSESPIRAIAPPEPSVDRHGHETILVAEDEEGIRRLIQRILERWGYRVIAGSDGVAAMELARELDSPIDLAISDVVMPRLSGTQFIAQLREIQPDVKVILMSGYAQEGTIEPAGACSDAEILEKPFTQDALLATVRRLLDAD